MQRIGIALATLLIASCGGIEGEDQQPEPGIATVLGEAPDGTRNLSAALGGAPDNTPEELPRVVRILTDSRETSEDGDVVAVDEEALLGPLSGNVQTKEFHTRHCPIYRCIGCIESFPSIPAALEAGYTPHDCAAQAAEAYLE